MKTLFTLLILAAIGAGLYITNPDTKQFRLHLRELGVEASGAENNVGRKVIRAFSGAAASAKSLATERSDYYLFSTYTMDWNGTRSEYLGIAGHFIEI